MASITVYSKSNLDTALAGKVGVDDTGRISSAVIPDLSGTYASAAALAGKVAKGSLVLNVKDYGATGDGTTDDTAAIRAAMRDAGAAGGGTVTFPPGVYASATLAVKSGVTLFSFGGATLKPLGAMVIFISLDTNAAGVGISGVDIDDAAGVVTSYLVQVSTGATQFHMEDCIVSGPTLIGVEIRDGVSGVTIERSKFDGQKACVQVNKDPVGVVIDNNQFVNWTDRAVFVLGSSTSACSGLWITNNRIAPHAPGGTARQPIEFSGDITNPFNDVHVTGNTVRGLGTSWTDPNRPGSADLISLHCCNGFDVSGNTVQQGGDMGITIALTCTNGTVRGNNCLTADTAGMSIGSTTGTIRSISVTGNTCINNGQNRQGDRNAESRCGIRLVAATAVVLSGNVFGDDQATKTQNYGVSIINSTNATVGPDVDSGVAIALYYSQSGNTALRKASTEALS